ncbi:MAG TPA: TetR/AcrR family transcriptional regulator [Streptosporangiaceae bacterium]|jgi:AcrR family transcriptional regulator
MPTAGVDGVVDTGVGRDETENAILDAASACVLAYGVRRTSLSDVARRAGVSRPTVYRRWPDRRALVADLMTRELGGVFRRAALQPAAGTARERAVDQFLAVTAGLRGHPLLDKIIQVDPELLQPYIFERLGTSQRMALAFTAELIRAGQRDGSIRDGDVDGMALTVLLSVQSAVLAARAADALVPASRRDAELAELLDRYLQPGGTRD